METTHGSNGPGVSEIDDSFDAKFHYERDERLDVKPIIKCNSECSESVDERGLLEASLSYAEKPQKVARKRTKCSNSVKSGEKLRVGCPFYKKDPKKHQKGSCRGVGYAEMGKLKDHLKDVHQLPKSIYKHKLNFKERKFTSLRGIDRKWKLVFQILFPEVHHDKIPSPYSNEDIIITAPLSNDLEVLRDNLRNILLARFRVDILCEIPDLEIEFDVLFSQAVKVWRNGAVIASTKPCGYTAEKVDIVAGMVDTITTKHYDTPPLLEPTQASPQLSKGCIQDFSGLPTAPELKTEDLYTPFPYLREHIHWDPQDDVDTKPAVDGLSNDCKIDPCSPYFATPPVLSNEQHLSKAAKVDMPGSSLQVLDANYRMLCGFDLNIPFDYSVPYVFGQNYPLALDSHLALDHNAELTTLGAYLPPTPSLTAVNNPFMGSDNSLEQTSARFSALNAPGEASLPSICMQENEEGVNIDEWLNLETCTPCSEWSEQQRQALDEEMDRQFELL
ncbi:uncharacterized protein K460DRAFT_414201 [Cucurbitaria berberidis CBS 394.84]|uniref:Uncharacterized protein n=1 Tax=Cucurbitaria berberidis CBS 394.84 TaxID=1168544 RepID=A0A9P4GLC5_9PLEO|nr:uncharacterized protein K460DRAFT_414201 [Cucurbitaria berberidis CBS 394.84]KAF1847456.1 hypothetical protein K460DRAFT_414201 [Cucurbitaria berberidis CBS 394.84]